MNRLGLLLGVALASWGCGGESGPSAADGVGGHAGAEANGGAAAGGAPASGGAAGVGAGSQGGGGERPTCVYEPTPDAIDYRTAGCAGASADPSERLSCALASAAASPTFTPAVDPSGYGPTEAQGVVRITFDPNSPPYQGANEIVFGEPAGGGGRFVAMPSNSRLEVDSGVRLVYGDDSVNGQLFEWDGVHDVTITRGDPCNDKGRFVVDLRSRVAPDAKARFASLRDVDRFLIEHVHTIAQYSPDVGGPGGGNGSGAPTLLFRADPDSPPPRQGIYRHHSNQGSAAGWGANQIASLSNAYIEDIWTDGGDALRFETSLGTIGSHNVQAHHIYAQNGNIAVALTPHDASSSDVVVTDVRAKSMYLGIGAFGTGPAGGVGVFTETSIDDVCVVAGDEAQGETDPAQSAAALALNIVAEADVVFTNVHRDGNFAKPNPGGTSDPSCNAQTVDDGFEDWVMELP